MSDEKVFPKVIEYRIKEADEHRLVYANGVWGGILPGSEIKAGFFIDTTENPELVVQEVTPEGHLGNEIQRTPQPELDKTSITREIQVTVIMSPATAEFVGNWLLSQVKLLKGE